MRILQLCKKFPYPVKDGECLAITQLAKSLTEEGAHVTLLAMDTFRHPGEQTSKNISFYKDIHTVQVDNRVKAIPAFLNLFSSKSYHIDRFVNNDFKQKLIDLLKANTFDIVQCETIYLAPYLETIRKHSKAAVVLRSHNVEHEIWERIATNTWIPGKKQYLQLLAKKLKNFEIDQLGNFDFIASISQKDLDQFKDFGYNGNASIVPIGLGLEDYAASFDSFKKDISLGFIGSLDWRPNQEGLMWFIENMWNDLKAVYPKISLHVAGRNAPDWIKALKIPGITFHGEVDCAKAFINKHSVMLVPLLSGSGMRAKILEGMALGKVVLTTRIGLEGIDAIDKEEVLVADNYQEFKGALDWCYQSNGSLKKIGLNAIELVEKNYNRRRIAKDLVSSYESILGFVPA